MGDDTKLELVANNSEDQVREATKQRLVPRHSDFVSLVKSFG